jgi:hypothetical protein
VFLKFVTEKNLITSGILFNRVIVYYNASN